MKRTPLFQSHLDMNAKMVDFSGWEMPIHYGSQVEEHHKVRADAGMFDVSHMTVVDLHGDNVRSFLKYLLANDVDKLQQTGSALYTCMLQEDAGVIDDLIVYFMDESWFRLIVNAATREKDLAWVNQQAVAYDVSVTEQADTAMIAVQGPNARQKAANCLEQSLSDQAMQLSRFSAVEQAGWFVARTGYTGEDGFEIVMPQAAAAELWAKLAAEGVAPIGLGARDTLRLEAGMNLYGSDMDETTSPLESGLAWTLALKDERDFIGRQALQLQKQAGVQKKLVGLVMEGKGILRSHQEVYQDDKLVGELTSGGFSPTLGTSIALARIDVDSAATLTVNIRGRQLPVRVVKYPFVRNGKACI